MDLPEIDAGSYRLRSFTSFDIPLIQEVSSDPLIPLITSVPTNGSEAEALAFIKRQHQRLTDGSGYSFAIAEAVSDKAIGQIGLWLKDLDQGRANIGYWVAPSQRRKGAVTHALSGLTNWALDQAGVHRLELYVEPWNEGSWRAAETCGFLREGLLHSWQDVGGKRQDMYMYSQLRP
nr:GNAT family protein [Arthrobacter roseus]